MDVHIDRLFEHVSSGGEIAEVEGRPVDPELLEMLHEFFRSEPVQTGRSERCVYGTNIRVIRPSLLIDRNINGAWYTLLGRSIPKNEKLKPGDVFKMGGGYIRLSNKLSEIDPSLYKGLLRETAEEGFDRRNSLFKKSVVPLGVVSAGADGVLALYTADLVKPVSARTDRPDFFFSDEYNKVWVKYFSLDEVVGSLADPVPLVKPETVECVARSYFWERPVKLSFSRSDHKKATNQGNIKIPKSIRQYVLRKTGLDDLDQVPEFNVCRIYYSVPFHRQEVQSLRLIFDTGIFLYEKVFTGQELGVFVRDGIKSGVSYKPVKEFVRGFLDSKLDSMCHIDIVNTYIKSSMLPDNNSRGPVQK